MSDKGKVDRYDLWSAVRHTVIPLIAGAGIAVLETVQSGTADWQTAQTAATTSIIAGVMRLLQRWRTTE